MQSVGLRLAASSSPRAPTIGGRILVVDDRENSTAPHPPGAARALRGRDHRPIPPTAIALAREPRLRPDHDQPVAARPATGCGSARRSGRSTGCGRRRSCSSPTPTRRSGDARARSRRERLHHPADRRRTSCARACARSCAASSMPGAAAQHGVERGRAGRHRSADRALQPPLSRRASAIRRVARADATGEAGLRADLRHRPFQGRSTTPTATMPATTS